MDYKKVKLCRICGSKRLRKYLDLGKVPLANSLVTRPQEVKKYPIQVLFCEDCSLSQLSIVVDPKVLYTNYPYHSSVSETFKEHCREMAEEINLINSDKLKTVIDIACNDGCLLNEFRETGGFFWHIGIDPSQNLISEAKSKFQEVNNKGHLDFRCEFWSKEVKAPRAQVITATNVLAHVDDVRGFLDSVYESLCLNKKSFCVVEFPYLIDLLDSNAFDTIYHEHLSYFLFKPVQKLFDMCGMRIFKVNRVKIHGGSLRVYACRKKLFRIESTDNSTGKNYNDKMIEYDSTEILPEDKSVKDMLKLEKNYGVYKIKEYLKFSKRVNKIRKDFKSLISRLKNKVIGYGASAKGLSLINYCNMDATHIPAIVDETPAKQGKFTAGSNIPIMGYDHFTVTKPDYIVLFAWNFAEEMKRKTSWHPKSGGEYIVAIPEVRIE